MTKEEAQNLECVLCPVKGGAMKQINLPSECEFLQNLKKIRNNEFNIEENTYNTVCIIPKDNILQVNRAWVHLSCALWSPDIYFQNFAEKTDIKYVDTILYEKFMEKCEVCGKRGYGPTIKCNKSKCNKKYCYKISKCK